MLSHDNSMNHAFFSSIVTMDKTWIQVFQSWNQTGICSMGALWLTATKEISVYCEYCNYVLEQQRCGTHLLNSQGVPQYGLNIWRCVTNDVSSLIAGKFPLMLQLCSSIKTTPPPCPHKFFDGNFEVVPHFCTHLRLHSQTILTKAIFQYCNWP